MTKPTLAIDFDDTLCLNAFDSIAVYNREHNATTTALNIYVKGTLGKPEYGWKHDEAGALAAINDYLTRPETLQREPIAGAVEALTKLAGRYRLVVMTGRPIEIEHAVIQWIDRYLPGLIDSVEHTWHTKKSVVCKKIGAKIIIDDSPEYIHDCHAAGIEVIVFGDYPRNQPDRLPEKASRAKTWDEVEKILC